jgi:hypothetical protein
MSKSSWIEDVVDLVPSLFVAEDCVEVEGFVLVEDFVFVVVWVSSQSLRV